MNNEIKGIIEKIKIYEGQVKDQKLTKFEANLLDNQYFRNEQMKKRLITQKAEKMKLRAILLNESDIHMNDVIIIK